MICPICKHDERDGKVLDCSIPDCGLGAYTAFAAAQVEFGAALAETAHLRTTAARNEGEK